MLRKSPRVRQGSRGIEGFRLMMRFGTVDALSWLEVRMSRTLALLLAHRGHILWMRALPIAIFLFAVMSITPRAAAAQSLEDANAMYQAHLADYLELREQLRQGVAREHILDPNIREISGALLAARIRQARAAAKPCDIIPAALADIVRDRLHRAFDPTEVDVLLMNLYPDGVPPQQTRINVQYDDHVAVAPPVAVLGALPPVPGVLGYRLVGRDVALWDEEANLVVDVIASALPEPRIWKFLDLSSFDLRERVRRALETANLDPQDLIEDMARDAESDAASPVIGEPFDWGLGAMMPPSVLRALPALPPQLEYRFVGSDLVVIDIQSGCVKGILYNALPGHTTVRDRAL